MPTKVLEALAPCRGLVHITQIRDGFVESVEDELSVGQEARDGWRPRDVKVARTPMKSYELTIIITHHRIQFQSDVHFCCCNIANTYPLGI